MDLDDWLHAVVSQKAVQGIRGAFPHEVADYLAPFAFVAQPNNNYLHPPTGIIVGDLHARNVLVASNGQLLVFDPVISLRTPPGT